MYSKVEKGFILMLGLWTLSGCNVQQAERISDVPSLATYLMDSPSDSGILTTPTPLFTFERDTNNVSDSTTCSSLLNPTLHPVELTVIKVINGPTLTTQTVVEQTVQMPDNCKFEFQTSSLQLVENEGYAWRVSEVGEVEDQNSEWNSFVYSPQASGLDTSDPYTCAGNLVADWSFANADTWRTNLLPAAASETIYQRLANGDGDSGAATISTQNNIVYQTLAQPIIQGNNYKLKFSLQHAGKLDFQIKVLAFNGSTPNSLQPNANVALIAQTGTMTYQQGNWIHLSLPTWEAIGNFTGIAIAIVDSQQLQVNFAIDKVCLSLTQSTGCAPSVDAPGSGVPVGLDFYSTVPVVTNSEYLAGSVNNLYPNSDTTTADWFEQLAVDDPALTCSSVGGELTPQEEYDLDLELIDPELDALLLDSYSATPQMDANITMTDTYTGDLQPILNNLTPAKCTKAVLNPNLPFSGRDIVYIHGLQLDALKGNLTFPGTFQEKWPADGPLFYSGGAIIEKAKFYWSQHIDRELGTRFDVTLNRYDPTVAPSNSFLVVSWSANQRGRYAIHAVLTQIRDAMAGTNPNVMLSAAGQARGQCFGDNGIVVITHSTGGLIASAMFGIAENSADPYANIATHGPTININSAFGDVRFITNKITAQVGVNAAYGGSPFAEVALKKLTGLLNTPLAGLVASEFVQQGAIVNWPPSVAVALNRSSLVDLVPSVATERWRPWMASRIPTLTMSGTFLDKAVFSPNIGKKMMTGFDDLVLSPSSQSNSYIRRPVFEVKHRRKLHDKGVGGRRAKGMLKDGKKASGTGYRNYYNTPYIAPTGMLQGNSVRAVTSPTNWHVPNHHLVLQTAGDHFDNVNKMLKNGNDYSFTINPKRIYLPGAPHSVQAKDQRNYEETGVVFNPLLYSTGLLNPAFGNLNQEWVRDETWGFYFIKIRMKPIKIGLFRIKVPVITMYYYEYLKWMRKYHLLAGYQTKMGADYMYDYVLR